MKLTDKEKAERYDNLKITIMPPKFTEAQKEFIDLRKENKQLKEKLEKIKGRWETINVDLDAPEDCVKMCYSLKAILEEEKKTTHESN